MGIESSLTTSFNADETNLLTKIRTSFCFFCFIIIIIVFASLPYLYDDKLCS